MVSHRHKAIFVHVPKAGGQSIETFFLNDLGLTRRTRTPLLLMPNPAPDVGPPRLAHLTAQEYTRYHYVTEEQFDEYLTFATVRDPWARAVSTYKYLGYHNSTTFRKFVERKLPVDLFDRMEYFVRPQFDYVAGSDGRVAVDHVLKLETLDADFDVIREALGLEGPLPHVNKSPPPRMGPSLRPRPMARYLRRQYLVARGLLPDHRDYREYYEPDLVERVADLYRRDVEAFGYRFDG